MSQLKETSDSDEDEHIPKPYSDEQKDVFQDITAILDPYEFARILMFYDHIPYRMKPSPEDVEYTLSNNILPITEDIIKKLDEWNCPADLQLDKKRQIVVLRKREFTREEREYMKDCTTSFKRACVTHLHVNKKIVIDEDENVKFKKGCKMSPGYTLFLKRAEEYGICHII